ncbi:MAG: M20/M25/M40 family metallo-hydrolase [Candidatus Thermoplasmatota archaeon]|nr:M20/M25/M40 family metallo-hydrolase [Candidatus Thermoplasmatota archaeon]
MAWSQTNEWIEKCSAMCSIMATEENPNGLQISYKWYVDTFEKMGFETELIFNDSALYRPLIIAKRPPGKGYSNYIGFFQHYDVEPIHKSWDTSPWNLIQKENRVFGRGIADNIGPFIQRLMVIEQQEVTNGIVFVVQGEEEIGSPFANEIYPNLDLPDVSLWVEETGYFYRNGNHRILIFNEDSALSSIVRKLEQINSAHGKATHVRYRPLNKAFGAAKCPCLSHLVRETPYIAIGPNDDISTIHGPNESISLNHLDISAKHLEVLLNYGGYSNV